MSKRSWDEALRDDGPSMPPSVQRRYSLIEHRHPSAAVPSSEPVPQYVPNISRKVKACAACRKHKIKCIMDESGPPCRRCDEKKLGCVLNKSLQTLISERSESSQDLVHDIEMMHSSLQKVLSTLNLPPLGRLQSSKQRLHTPSSDELNNVHHEEEILPSCDASPKALPEDDHDLPKPPIQSLYHLTKLSALRSPDTVESNDPPSQRGAPIDDFISRGILPIEEAQRLFNLYMNHLDHFMYGIGGRHKTLDVLRRSSRILTVSILTVAALHDHQSNSLYGVCSKEFRRQLAASFLNRRIDRDYLRAMCIASYWLSEINWTVSGYAIRRATEFNLVSHYNKAIGDGNEESADLVRLWYIMYICDQHLSTLYDRPSIIREDLAIHGWSAFLESPAATNEDKRLVSQVALLNIVHNIHDLFGPDKGEPVPQVYLTQIASFGRQLDQWLKDWSTTLLEHHEHIGRFPRKGVLLHYHFSKLHLYSHVFRGLRNAEIPSRFLDSAASATSAAVAIISTLINDPEIRPALIGIPSYMHSMTAFAAMFLSKLVMTYGDQLLERAVVIDLISRLIELYHSTAAGKFHLVNMMANGLERIIKTLKESSTSQPEALRNTDTSSAALDANTFPDFADLGLDGETVLFDTNFLMDFDMNLGASAMHLGSGPTAFESTDLSPRLL